MTSPNHASRRNYRMRLRAEAVASTRGRILEAARALHAEQGIAGTAYELIARRAGVAQATVYRHFPTLDTLIPACAEHIVVLQPATAEHAEALFAGLDTPLARIDRLIEGTCDCYERDAGWLHAARSEERLHPSLAKLSKLAVANMAFLVHTALEGTETPAETERTVVALIDFPFWRSLQAAGFTSEQARERVRALVRQQLGHAGRMGGEVQQ